jgi:hypothetical protein
MFCCGCQADVPARLTTGAEIYPRRRDLAGVCFWRCDDCRNYVGCHRGRKDYLPLGVIPTAEMRAARSKIHEILDPLWQNGGPMRRSHVYAELSQVVGRPYHTAELRDIHEARRVYRAVVAMRRRYPG